MAISNAIAEYNSGLICAGYHAPMPIVRTDRLKDAMIEARLDQPALAKAVGCTQGAISQILLGNTQRSRYLPDIASELGVSLQWLRGESDNRDPTAPPTPTAKDVSDHFDLAIVPQLDLGYSMGGGSVFDAYEQTGFVPFHKGWLRALANGTFDQLFVARGEGDSMLPTMMDGDIVLIDTAQAIITKQDRIWAVSYGELGMIKRVRRQPDGRFNLMSDNQAVSPLNAAPDEIHVIGRVVWIGRRM